MKKTVSVHLAESVCFGGSRGPSTLFMSGRAVWLLQGEASPGSSYCIVQEHVCSVSQSKELFWAHIVGTQTREGRGWGWAFHLTAVRNYSFLLPQMVASCVPALTL